MTQQVWADLGHVSQVERGTRPATLLLTFTNPVEASNFLAELCSGHMLTNGHLRHDTGRHCLVHGYDHDGCAPERLALYPDDRSLDGHRT